MSCFLRSTSNLDVERLVFEPARFRFGARAAGEIAKANNRRGSGVRVRRTRKRTFGVTDWHPTAQEP